MDKPKTDKRIRWFGAPEIPEDERFRAEGLDEQEYPHERILQQLSANAVNITKITDRLTIARQMDEEGQGDENNQKLIGVLTEELKQFYEDRDALYRIDALRDLLDSI